MYKKITRAVDFVFTNLIIYAISFVWIRYYVNSLLATVFLALTATLVIFLLIKALTYTNKERKQYKGNELKEIEKHVNSLIFMTKSEQNHFLDRLYENHFSQLKFSDVTRQDIVNAVKWAKEKDYDSVNIILNDVSPQIAAYCKSIQHYTVNIVDKYKLFEDMKKLDFYPKETVQICKQRMKARDVLSYAFSKKRAKGYILTGFLLIATSFLLPYKIYYITIGSILLFIALLCLTLNNKI